MTSKIGYCDDLTKAGQTCLTKATYTVAGRQLCRTHFRAVPDCEWCEHLATITINWPCGHPSAICQRCFDAPDPWNEDGYGLDIMDFDTEVCPNCAG